MDQFEEQENGEHWIILSDLAMGGFVLFLSLTLIFMVKANVVNNNTSKLKGIFKPLKEELIIKTKDFNFLEILDNGVIRFKVRNENDELFVPDKAILQPYFKRGLERFIPTFFDIILKYIDNIEEIRIEGHTAGKKIDWDYPNYKPTYFANLELSQKRINKVFELILKHQKFQNLPAKKQSKLWHLFVTAGYANAKILDANGDYCYNSKKEINRLKSRRVDFKIILNGDKKN